MSKKQKQCEEEATDALTGAVEETFCDGWKRGSHNGTGESARKENEGSVCEVAEEEAGEDTGKAQGVEGWKVMKQMTADDRRIYR